MPSSLETSVFSLLKHLLSPPALWRPVCFHLKNTFTVMSRLAFEQIPGHLGRPR